VPKGLTNSSRISHENSGHRNKKKKQNNKEKEIRWNIKS